MNGEATSDVGKGDGDGGRGNSWTRERERASQRSGASVLGMECLSPFHNDFLDKLHHCLDKDESILLNGFQFAHSRRFIEQEN